MALLLLAAATVRAHPGIDMPNACDLKPDPNKPFDLSFSTDFTTDYVYRGVTLSARQPAVGASIEIDYAPFYVRFEPHSVKLPTNPSAELGFSAGLCKQIFEGVKFDIGASYLYYPGEIPVGAVTSTSYGEAHATISVEPIKDLLTLTAMYAYSPNFSNTGAWSQYVEGGFDLELPKKVLPKDFTWSLGGAWGIHGSGPSRPMSAGFPCRNIRIGTSASRSSTKRRSHWS